MPNNLSSCHVPVKVEVLFISMHQLHFGLLQGPQLPFVMACPSEVLPDASSTMSTHQRHLMRTGTKFISEISAATIFTSFDFHPFDFLVKGR